MKVELYFTRVLLALALLVFTSVNATNILYVSTAETQVYGVNIETGAVGQLRALANINTVNCGTPDIFSASNTDTVTCYSSILSDVTLTRPDFYSVDAYGNPYDIIIGLSVYNYVSSAHLTAINQSAVTNPNTSIILFRDACGVCGGSGVVVVQQISNLIKTLNPSSTITAVGGVNYATPVYVNPNSSFFTASNYAPTIHAREFTDFINVPRDNILYYTNNAAATNNLDFDHAYSVVLPASQSIGACLLATVDTDYFSLSSPFGNSPNVMKDYIGSAKRTGSACGAISPLRLTEKVTNDNGRISAIAGDTLTYTLTLTNTSAINSYPGQFIYNPIPVGTTYVVGSITSSDVAVFPTNDTTTSLTWGIATNSISPSATYTLTFKVKVNSNINSGVIMSQASDYYSNFSYDVTGVAGSSGPKGQTIIPIAPIIPPISFEVKAAIPTNNIFTLISLVILMVASSCYVYISYRNNIENK